MYVCSTCYTASQMKNSRRSASAINQVTMENTDLSHLQTYGSHCSTVNQQHLRLPAKQRKVHDACIVHTVACEKTPVRLKQCQMVEKSSL